MKIEDLTKEGKKLFDEIVHFWGLKDEDIKDFRFPKIEIEKTKSYSPLFEASELLPYYLNIVGTATPEEHLITLSITPSELEDERYVKEVIASEITHLLTDHTTKKLSLEKDSIVEEFFEMITVLGLGLHKFSEKEFIKYLSTYKEFSKYEDVFKNKFGSISAWFNYNLIYALAYAAAYVAVKEVITLPPEKRREFFLNYSKSSKPYLERIRKLASQLKDNESR